jgi:hypothetical protein
MSNEVDTKIKLTLIMTCNKFDLKNNEQNEKQILGFFILRN